MSSTKKYAELRGANGEPLIQFFGPHAETDPLSLCLRTLTHQLSLRVGSHAGGFFGGPFGYGVDFENDVFEMHPDWQGDCTCGASEPIHSPECRAIFDVWLDGRNAYAVVPSTPADIDAEVQAHIARGFDATTARLSACLRPYSFERESQYEQDHPRPACVCEAREWVERDEHDPSCRLMQHCFTHKASGLVVDWYKYIGRDNEIVHDAGAFEIAAIFDDCLSSIGSPSLTDAFTAYVAAEREHEHASNEFMDRIAKGIGKD